MANGVMEDKKIFDLAACGASDSARRTLAPVMMSVLLHAVAALSIILLTGPGDKINPIKKHIMSVSIESPMPEDAAEHAVNKPSKETKQPKITPAIKEPRQAGLAAVNNEPAAAPEIPRPPVVSEQPVFKTASVGVEGASAIDAAHEQPAPDNDYAEALKRKRLVAKESALSLIRDRIERALRYPELARRRAMEGTVQTAFRIDQRGMPLTVAVAKSSGHAVLDDEAKKIIMRAAPYPADESLIGEDIIVPITFRLSAQ